MKQKNMNAPARCAAVEEYINDIAPELYMDDAMRGFGKKTRSRILYEIRTDDRFGKIERKARSGRRRKPNQNTSITGESALLGLTLRCLETGTRLKMSFDEIDSINDVIAIYDDIDKLIQLDMEQRILADLYQTLRG
jgi:hypothetical protein